MIGFSTPDTHNNHEYEHGIHQRYLDIPTVCCGHLGEGKYRVYGKEGLQGPCRLVDRNGNVVQGDFQNGYCQQAYVYYAYANFAVGEWVKGNLNGRATIYSYSGKKVYEGQMVNGMRHGQGIEYKELANYSFKGTWVNDLKDGWFEQTVQEGNTIERMEGSYINGLRDGEFEHWINDTIVQVKNFYRGKLIANEQQIQTIDRQLSQRRKYEEAQNKIKTQSMTLYNLTAPDECVNDLHETKMLDTVLLTMFARRIFDYLEYKSFGEKHNNQTILFGTDLLEKYAGFGLNCHKYQSVEAMTRHLQGNFSLVSGFWKTIMFPLTNGPHFTLAVVRVHREKQRYSFTMQYYDSLNGTYMVERVMKSVRGFLAIEYKQHYKKQNKQIENGICNMKIKQVQCPRQYDGVSCGIFVSKFMYELATKGSLVNKRQYTYIENFRKLILNFLQVGVDKFEEVCLIEHQLYQSLLKDNTSIAEQMLHNSMNILVQPYLESKRNGNVIQAKFNHTNISTSENINASTGSMQEVANKSELPPVPKKHTFDHHKGIKIHPPPPNDKPEQTSPTRVNNHIKPDAFAKKQTRLPSNRKH